MIPEIFTRLAVALGLGLLVGLQRERTDSAIAGIRRFALITLFGAIAAQLGPSCRTCPFPIRVGVVP